MSWLDELIDSIVSGGSANGGSSDMLGYSPGQGTSFLDNLVSTPTQGGGSNFQDFNFQLPSGRDMTGFRNADDFGSMVSQISGPPAPASLLPDVSSGSGNLWDTIQGAGKWMDNNKTLTSLGMGGLSLLSSIPAAKKAAEIAKKRNQLANAALSKASAASERANAPYTGPVLNRTYLGLAPGQGTVDYSRSGGLNRAASIFANNNVPVGRV
jgi:hypothetical protein